MKHKKWIILFAIILIILIVFVITIMALNKEDNDINEKLSSTAWWNYKNEYYENNALVSSKTKFTPLYYVIFNQNKAKYCNGETQECLEYSYVYENNEDKIIIKINSGDYFIPKGTYEVDLGDDNTLKLINYSNSKKTIYHLIGAIG